MTIREESQEDDKSPRFKDSAAEYTNDKLQDLLSFAGTLKKEAISLKGTILTPDLLVTKYFDEPLVEKVINYNTTEENPKNRPKSAIYYCRKKNRPPELAVLPTESQVLSTKLFSPRNSPRNSESVLSFNPNKYKKLLSLRSLPKSYMTILHNKLLTRFIDQIVLSESQLKSPDDSRANLEENIMFAKTAKVQIDQV
jgi:hypothetical protein